MKTFLIASLASFVAFMVFINLPLAWLSAPFGAFTTISGTDNINNFPTTYNANLTKTIEIGTTSVASITTLANLASLGTITSGTWQGTTIDELYGGTGFSTYATGDLIYASGTNTLSKLTASSTNEVLTLVGGVPVWRDAVVNEANNYNWTGLHTFTNASSTLFSAYTSYFGGTATSTFDTGGLLNILGNWTLAGDDGTASSTALSTDGSGNTTFNTIASLGGGHLLAATSTNETVTDSASYITYGDGDDFNPTIVGGLLGTGGAIKTRISISGYSDDDNDTTSTIRVNLGGTSVCGDITLPSAPNSTADTGELELTIYADSSQSAQTCMGQYLLFESSTTVTGYLQIETTSSVDLSSDQAFTVTFGGNDDANSNGGTVTINGVTVEVIGKP